MCEIAPPPSQPIYKGESHLFVKSFASLPLKSKYKRENQQQQQKRQPNKEENEANEQITQMYEIQNHCNRGNATENSKKKIRRS